MVIYHSAVGGLILSIVMSTVCVIMVAAVKKCRGKCVPVLLSPIHLWWLLNS